MATKKQLRQKGAVITTKNLEFEDSWALYPRKQGKNHALNHYKVLLDEYTKEEIDNAILKYSNEVQGWDKKYIMMGNNFFRTKIYNYLEIKEEKKEKKPEIFKDKIYEDYIKHMRAMDYNDYIHSEHWRHFREQTLIFYGYKCVVCSDTDKLAVHHKTYENRGRETFNDVIVVCNKCHETIHGRHEEPW